jgi:lipopolysaccharide assembly outer membrane protein LptD (OstA)
MKKLIQFFLFFIIIIIGVIFYQKYLIKPEPKKIKEITLNEKNPEELSNKNNLIKNLTYNVKFDDSSQYIITADFSEIKYENDIEIVEMEKVTAKIINKDNSTLIITGDTAIFNNSNFNTNFEKNVKIEYLDNIIYSDKLDLNFAENIVIIYDNVNYIGADGKVETDNVIINLITKNIEIFMHDPKKKVKVTSKSK